MKKHFILFSFFALCFITSLQAQVVNPADATKDAATNATNNNINNSANSAVDKLQNGIKGLFKKKKNKSTDNSGTNSDQAAPGNSSDNSGTSSAGQKAGPPTLSSYANYDFVPGDTIIFQSQLADEQVGEIPSQFILSNGQMDIQQQDGENVIHVPKGPGATFTARMTNADYMPQQFTVEFDFMNEKTGIGHLNVDFGHRVYYSGGEGITPGMTFNEDNTMTWTLGDATFPSDLNVNYDHPMEWHHVAIAINKNVGKVYIDQFRVVNVNNLTGKPENVTIDVNGYENSYIKNIRIAAGGIDIYKQVTTATKIITHGILFDIDQATIKPASMGTINKIYMVLKNNPGLKFEIDGHTDNSGNAPHNLILSQQRADAVKNELVSLGIDGSRLSTKGYGDTRPIDTNDTPEGKANNRRVEFIKD